MKAHYLQHVPFEGLGYIEKWLVDSGYSITATRIFEKAVFPDIESIDFLIIMGGPMSVNDEDRIPWLQNEKKFIREYIATEKPVLGICLGAQLIADVLGSKVYPNTQKEIGWFPVRECAPGKTAFRLNDSKAVFHWHGETFDLPEGAIRLAENDACKNQAFQFRDSVFGFQFHLEVTPETVEGMLENCGPEIVKGRYIQTMEEIRRQTLDNYKNVNCLLENVLGNITRILR